jgi:uncharacterized protein (TIGR01244 family)
MVAPTSLPIRPVAGEVFVAPQLAPGDLAEAARAGFRSIVNNRPDFEGGPDQPTHAEMAAAAGLEYRFLPVNGAYQSPEEIKAFGALMAELPHPVLAFCRSGARSTRLYMAALGG